MTEGTEQLLAINELSTLPITKELVESPAFADQYSKLVSLTKYLEDLKRNVDANIKEIARDNYLATGENSIVSGPFQYVYVPATTRETFNNQQFKEDHPDLFRKYVRVSSVSDQVRTLRIKPRAEASDE